MFFVKDLDSIKENGLLVSYSKRRDGCIPSLGYGIYAVESKSIHDVSDEFVEFLSFRYNDEDKVGYVEGTYKGKYLECIYDFAHAGYLLLKEDVTLDMINNIDSDYISKIIQNY